MNYDVFISQTGLSYVSAAGLVPVIEMLSEVPELDPNIPDKEGNTPLIFAAQAGKFLFIYIYIYIYIWNYETSK